MWVVRGLPNLKMSQAFSLPAPLEAVLNTPLDIEMDSLGGDRSVDDDEGLEQFEW